MNTGRIQPQISQKNADLIMNPTVKESLTAQSVAKGGLR